MMLKPSQFVGMLAVFGFLLGSAGAIAVTSAESGIAAPKPHMPLPHNSTANQEFQRIEQPLRVKLPVTAIGGGLIGLELWWFLWSKPKSQKAHPRKPA